MENFRSVQEKLEAFIKKYYLNSILKGSLLFIATGLIYFLVVVGLEYLFWLSSSGRTILFWLFIMVELGLIYLFIGIPLFRLLKISDGIDEFEASRIIGKHFPEVSDKLTNLLQLKKCSQQSDLLLASIDQRSRELNPIPFTRAIDLKQNRKYLRYVLWPFLILLGLIVAGKADVIINSFNRISNYNTAYVKPSPFNFIIQNTELKAWEGENFQLQIRAMGDYNPEKVELLMNDTRAFMKQPAPGIFEYTFTGLSENVEFRLFSNEVISTDYELEVIKVPKLLNFEIFLNYPEYTGLRDENLSGTGNVTVPEGTQINWKLHTRNTKYVNFSMPDSLVRLSTDNNRVDFSKTVSAKLPYSVSTSNMLIKDFEELSYQIEVIRDEYPVITVISQKDTLNNDIQLFKGNVSDDYGLSKLQLVYFTPENKEEPLQLEIPVSKESFDEFHFGFPGNLELEPGKEYNYYFRVFDNDAVNGAKSARSETYTYRKKSKEEEKEENLKLQNDAIRNISESLDEFEKSEEELEEISRLEKEREELNYNERKKLEDFLNRQKKQNDLMKSYSEKLEKSLEKFSEDSTPMEKELSDRLKRNEDRLEKNEALLKELEKYSEKIRKEDLGKKLEELSRQNKNNQRNLEQLLELTKRYYVEEKKQKLARDLENLADKQEKLSEKKEDNTPENQEKLNKEFEKFKEGMDDLEEENQNLKEPQELGREEVDEESIEKYQKKATESLKENENTNAKEKQKDAARKMRKMSAQMQQMSMEMQAQQMEADAETLRQILDNLIVFSFEQEALLNNFRSIQQNNPKYAASLKEQSNLRENFRHVDDSLYTLALRNPMVNETITEKLTNIEFDIGKAIERLSENEIPQGTASQQYVVTGANDLANLLDNILSSMQQMMANPQAGKGKGGKEFQLQDIIKKQEDIMEQMKDGTKTEPGKQQQGNSKNSGEGENGELYEIYKEQQMLRMQMEKLLQGKEGKDGNKAVEEMKKIEEQLLDKGFDPETLKRMQQLQYELLKFEKARKLQGMDDKRKSETNRVEYENSLQNQIEKAKEYFNSTEILNRQILPLRQIYREKVKEYFGKGRD